MVVLYRLSHEAENVRDPTDGHQITVYKLTISILSELSENARYIDRQHYYLAVKDEPEPKETKK
jgi:hypothetical protein